MATLTISFTPPATPPADGYLVTYGIPGEAVQTVSPNPTSSPVVIDDLTPGSVYTGSVQGDCGSGNLSAAQAFTANPVFPPSAYGALIVDIDCASTADICANINTPGFTEDNVIAYPGNNFSPMSSSASPDSCDILSSDYSPSQTFAKLRFEFNVKKHIIEYPGIGTFIYQILGRDTSAGSVNCNWNLKGADDSTLTMSGSPGTYYPSVINSSDPFTPASFTFSIGAGADGTYSPTLPVLATFTYTVSTNSVVQS
jgi:hypothetical protein